MPMYTRASADSWAVNLVSRPAFMAAARRALKAVSESVAPFAKLMPKSLAAFERLSICSLVKVAVLNAIAFTFDMLLSNSMPVSTQLAANSIMASAAEQRPEKKLSASSSSVATRENASISIHHLKAEAFDALIGYILRVSGIFFGWVHNVIVAFTAFRSEGAADTQKAVGGVNAK